MTKLLPIVLLTTLLAFSAQASFKFQAGPYMEYFLIGGQNTSGASSTSGNGDLTGYGLGLKTGLTYSGFEAGLDFAYRHFSAKYDPQYNNNLGNDVISGQMIGPYVAYTFLDMVKVSVSLYLSTNLTAASERGYEGDAPSAKLEVSYLLKNKASLGALYIPTVDLNSSSSIGNEFRELSGLFGLSFNIPYDVFSI
ncbi:MAG: hypothetical protein A2381_11340 [Bdellovibrionales bacterium RIFOXYB1_FULL_37_110]|nr:MAG: hypothetical protein A2417_11645 [Bdellovibrionales bacterium RIFOXYC1_FULL_37_79]OFZ57286.1 MAG: hypothetical protein A2381_11340 [Bdellovibrionales bacterium RIFOXYB1_FULL_37_110]OFZ62182.1 MAG: hypothetical protein A2577_13890 [Bdellovibrionales bacterium RIFOXYD1_FULL_36_51]